MAVDFTRDVTLSVGPEARFMGRVEGLDGLKDLRAIATLGRAGTMATLAEKQHGDQLLYYAVLPDREPINLTTEGKLIDGIDHWQPGDDLGPAGVGQLAIRLTKDGKIAMYNHDQSGRPTQLVLPQREVGPTKPPETDQLSPVRSISCAVQERARHGDDRSLVLSNYGVMGVFDGVGGDARGAKAALQVASCLEHAYQQQHPAQVKQQPPAEASAWMVKKLNSISQSIYDQQQGLTTAVLAQVVKHLGQDYVTWASIGDSRLYLKRDGEVYQLTTDDGQGHRLTRAIGAASDYTRYVTALSQIGTIPVGAGDVLFACSDGITGDYGTDIMTQAEMAYCLGDCLDATVVADSLLTSARKADDQTVAVMTLA